MAVDRSRAINEAKTPKKRWLSRRRSRGKRSVWGDWVENIRGVGGRVDVLGGRDLGPVACGLWMKQGGGDNEWRVPWCQHGVQCTAGLTVRERLRERERGSSYHNVRFVELFVDMSNKIEL